MTINIGNLKIWCTRRRDHKNFLWRSIYELRQEIIDEILISTRNDTHLDEPELRRKAILIRKYSRRLKNMSY
jgi:hypothetical protein